MSYAKSQKVAGLDPDEVFGFLFSLYLSFPAVTGPWIFISHSKK
jgi:hypothetical protein